MKSKLRISTYVSTVLIFLSSTVSKADDKRSIVFVPVVSGLLPSFGQFVDGEYKKATSIFGLTVAGFLVAEEGRKRINEFWESDSTRFHSLRDNRRVRDIGYTMIKHASGLSLYDTFLNRVGDYQKEGKYLFLPKEQNLESIQKAPFEFSYLKKPTTYIPFALGFGVGILQYNRRHKPDHFDLRLIDVTSSSYQSYVAGVTEEAVFRGWLQPILYENTQSFWIANTIQALGFGFAHGPKAYFPIAFGFYAGWLAPANNWDLGELIFIHTWWDVFVITAEYARNRSFTEDFNISLPLLNMMF